MRIRTSRILLLAIPVLLAWKAVRADWVVTAPYWYFRSYPKASETFGTETYTPPIGPIWHPPIPREIVSDAKSWLHFFDEGGGYGPAGSPVLRPNWELMIVKLFGAFFVVGITAFVLARSSRPPSPPTQRVVVQPQQTPGKYDY